MRQFGRQVQIRHLHTLRRENDNRPMKYQWTFIEESVLVRVKILVANPMA